MKLTTTALLLLASASFADAPSRVEASLARGEDAILSIHDAKGTKLLRALEAAKPHFARARRLAAKGLEGAPGDEALANAYANATGRLVAILNAETVLYLERDARPLARKRNGEALRLLPKDERALALKDAIASPDPYVPDVGVVDLVGGVTGKPQARTGVSQRYLDRRRASFAR